MARPARSTRAGTAISKRTSTAAMAAASTGRSIDSFGRVSKRVVPASGKNTAPSTIRPEAAERFLSAENKGETKAVQKQVVVSVSIAELPSHASPEAPKAASTKRKRASDDDESSQNSTSQPPAASNKRARRPIRKTKTASPAATSIATLLTRQPKKKPAASLPTPSPDSDNDSLSTSFDVAQQAGQLFARLNLQSSFSSSVSVGSASPPRSSSSSPRPASTAPTTPCDSDVEDPLKLASEAVLPVQLVDLIDLQSAFVKALTLYHAHHGANTPADIRILCPSIAQAWGKRRVTLDDLQRCLGILAQDSSVDVLLLSDYGHNKTCVELRPDAHASSTLSDQLNRSFEATLRSLWANNSNSDAQAFIQNLPKALVAKNTSLLKASAVRAKGQRSLESLMQGIAQKKQEREAKEAKLRAELADMEMEVDQPQEEAPKETTPQTKLALNANGAPMSLLDRIRYRQLQRTQQAAAGLHAPTPEELERRAALHRAGDIAEVLVMLCASSKSNMGQQQSRLSFGMAALVAKIRDSQRLPISREEAASCVRLLSKEVAPQWLQMVSMGGREIVIALTDFAPSKAAIQTRVQELSQQ